MNPSTSPEKIEANRANARRSTGPITEEGKAHSSQNARVHGLCSRQLHLADEEETAVFASLRAALSSALVPAGELELIHFETILHSQWNLRRCRMNEAKLLASVPDPYLDPETRAALKTLATYVSRHERAVRNATKELKFLQNERATRTNFAAGGEMSAEPSPLVETSRVRRTLLAEIRAKAALNKASLEAAIQQIDKGSPIAPVSYFQFDLAPRNGASETVPLPEKH
jgi:hypothetical protein